MKGARFLRSLHFRVALGVIATILLISGLYIVIDYRSSRAHLFEELRRSADRLAEISLRGMLELAMVGEHPEMLQPALERMASGSSVGHVSLLDLQGVVRFSSRPSDLGRRFDISDEGCRNCHMEPSGELRHSVFFHEGEGLFLRDVRLVPNRPECRKCHDPSQQHNGILIVDFPTEDVQQRLSAELKATAYRAGLTTLLTLLVLGLLMNKLVIQRVQRLSEAASRTADTPDVSAFARVTGSDEIGQLARSFEAMAGRLEVSFRNLQSERAYLQKLVNSLSDGLIVVGRGFQVQMKNQAACDFWSELELDELLKSDHSMSQVARCLHQTFKTGAPGLCETKTERRGESGGAEARFIEIQCSPLRDAEGEVAQAILLVRDVTQRKALEAQAGRSDRLASVGRLAAGVAHEINNPMAAITTCVEGLSRHVEGAAGIDPSEKAEIRDYLSTVGEAALRCKEITQRLLNSSVDPESDTFERVDLREVAREALTLVEHQAGRQGVRIESPSPRAPTVVLGNRRKLSQLLLNLLLNSLEALSAGGRLRVSLGSLGDFVRLDVADNGSGISEEHLDHIFDPFFTTKKEGRGTGLGLSICQWIVRQHQGRIEVASRPGEGATFTVLFPRHETRAP